ncbi:hypothetical protein Tco_0268674 [Tanacetum coccineum]
MSSYTYPSIPFDYDVEDAFSSTNAPNYILTPPGYSPVTPGNISPDSSDDLTKDLLSSLSISPFHDDPYMKVIQAYDAIPPPQVIIALPAINASQKDINICSTSHDSGCHLEKQLVAGSVAIALETQTANMENTDNTNGNTGPR